MLQGPNPIFCYWCFHVTEPRRKDFMFKMYVTESGVNKHRELKTSVSLDDLSFIH